MKGSGFYTEEYSKVDDLKIKHDDELLIEDLRRILFTIPGERVNNPTFGCKLMNYLFELESIDMTALKANIVNSIETFLPQHKVNLFELNTIDHVMYISIIIEDQTTGRKTQYQTEVNK